MKYYTIINRRVKMAAAFRYFTSRKKEEREMEDRNETKAEKKKTTTYCVTGSTGYIGSWLVKYLLQKGYTVNATLRNPGNPNTPSSSPELTFHFRLMNYCDYSFSFV